jgi:hypothetical protein
MKKYKGTLKKLNEEWVVFNDIIDPFAQITNPLPIHKSFYEILDKCFSPSFSQEVDFEIMNEYTHPELYDGVPLWQGKFYAKLINPELK